MIRYIVLALLALALLITATVAFTVHFVEKRRVIRVAARARVIAAGQPDRLRPDPHPPNEHRHDPQSGFIVDQLGAQGQQTAQVVAQGQSQQNVQSRVDPFRTMSRDLADSVQQMQRGIQNSLIEALGGTRNQEVVNVEIRTTVEGAPDQVVADILRERLREAQENQQPTPAEQRRFAETVEVRRRAQQQGRQGTAPVPEEPRPEPKTRFQRDPVI